MSLSPEKIRIGLAGSFTVDPLTRYLSKALTSKRFGKPEYSVAPYNQITQLSFNPEAVLGGAVDYLVVLWRIEDVIPDLLGVNALSELDEFIAALQRLRQNFQGTLIISTPPYPFTPQFDVHDLEQPLTGAVLFHSMLQRITAAIREMDGVQILNLSGLVHDLGLLGSHDARKWYLYKQPYTESLWRKLAEQTSRLIAAQKIAAKKAIVVDCDNTLWGGIVGEDGISGIHIGQDFPGSAFRDFQRHLLHLRAKGLFLGVASKNNEDDVYEVFDSHDAMVLQRDHISSWQVHWRSKVESLLAIADELNIGTDSLVFVDDNPKEIAEVEERMPEVTCILVPEELAYLPSVLQNTGLFDIASITDEDRKRADMMLAESKRKNVNQATMTEEDFIKSLELQIKVFEARPQHLGRITQLINKTNQFNLTTIRRTADEIENLHRDDDTLLFGMDISDRFGDYGLVGVAIVKKLDGVTWDIDSLMMSCRVLGRSAETSFLAKIAEAVSLREGIIMHGAYVATQKNALVKDLLSSHYFQQKGERWTIEVENIKQPPGYVNVSLLLNE